MSPQETISRDIAECLAMELDSDFDHLTDVELSAYISAHDPWSEARILALQDNKSLLGKMGRLTTFLNTLFR